MTETNEQKKFTQMIRDNFETLREIHPELPAMYLGLLCEDSARSAENYSNVQSTRDADIASIVKKAAYYAATRRMTDVEIHKALFSDPIERFEEYTNAMKRESELNPKITLRDIAFSDDPYSMIAKLPSEEKEFVENLLNYSPIEEWKAIFRALE